MPSLSCAVYTFPHESGLISESRLLFFFDFCLLLLLLFLLFSFFSCFFFFFFFFAFFFFGGGGGLTLYVFLHLTVMYSFTFWKSGWVLAVYI